MFHLPFFKSDHRAVLMQTKKREKSNRNRRPFRFLASWITHENFSSFMARAWPRSAPWCGQLPYFQGSLKVWNKRVFGSIFDRKNGLIRRLEAVSEKLIANPTADLERAHKRLWQEYEHVLMQEEILWFQKSRSKWISFGDRNSRFFHGVTVVRRRKNSFDLLQDDNGNWVSDPIELESMVTNYFKTLFAEQGNREPTCIMGAFPPLHEEDRVDINKVVTRSEIFNVINHMGAFKAPGMDGFQAVFFQSQWPIIGDSLCNMVFDIFREPSKVRDINETLITLIPKVEQVRNIKHFRPISLCNVSYKVITKLLANRLRLIMGKLVNPCQSSFVPNRQSRDNIIVAQEIFHSMRRKKGKKGWMAIKIDLEKAYDRLSWAFIKETLEDIGLPSNFIELVWHCISTVRMRMMWKGEALEEFTPSRGVRQGDLISPYLFVLCLKKLFQMIGLAIEHNRWKPIQINKGCPMLSHLAFADDVLLFAEANVHQIRLIKQILDLFCRCSGQKLSEEKTRIFFSKNVGRSLKHEICQESGFQVTDDLGKYLGVPILHEKVNSRTFQFILDKVDQRLSNWKVKTLSFAGRVSLTKSVLQALPSYVMHSAYVPKFICSEIDKRCRSFVWGESGPQRRMHLVKWENLCRPKSWGGLGLKSARHINKVFMLKAGWQLISRKEDLWVQVVRSKYRCGNEIVPRMQVNKPGSNLWRGLCNVWEETQNNLVWRAGNGKSINVWSDIWLPTVGKIGDIVNRPLSMVEANLRVWDLVSD